MQVVVLGMHRSGTSAVTRLVGLMGAWNGPDAVLLPPAPDNPAGYWERADAMALNERLLALHGAAWDRVATWPPDGRIDVPEDLDAALRAFVAGLDAHRPWVLKDPRLCLTLGAWRPHLDAPVALLVHRDPHEIARSLAARNSMPRAYALALWEVHAVHALNATLGMQRIHVGHADVLRDPWTFTRTLCRGLVQSGVAGLREPPEREVTGFIDPRLYRARIGGPGEAPLSPSRQILASMLRGLLPQHAPVGVSPEALDGLRAGYVPVAPAAGKEDA